MQKVTVLCVGKLKEAFYEQAVKEYEKRLSRCCKLERLELPEQRLGDEPSEAEIRQALKKEAALVEQRLSKGGALIGVNAFTLDGDETAIADAKDVLAKKGATYQNVYFDSSSPAGAFTANIFAFPTTYVVDRNGNIVGEPIVGAITEKNQAETLQSLIDQAIAADAG